MSIRDFLNKMVAVRCNVPANGFKYICQEDFVLKHGRQYRPRKTHLKKMMPKQCFSNALSMALRHGLVYVEGYAMMRKIGLSVHHAWNCLPGSMDVIDVTWETLGVSYLGVAFNPRWVLRHTDGSALDDWKNGWPILQGNVPEETWKWQSEAEALR